MFTGVYNKKTDEFRPCNDGEHWIEIQRMIEEEFGRNACLMTEYYGVFDAWITRNIELIGNNALSSTYRFSKPAAIYVRNTHFSRC